MKRRTKSFRSPHQGRGLTAWRRLPRSRSRRGSRHLFDRWAEIEGRLTSARRVTLFLDFDGTLAPLRDRPEDVWLDSGVRDILARLARNPHVDVCLISGRTLTDLRKRAKVRGVIFMGLHGNQRRGTGKKHTVPPALVRAKAAAFRRLDAMAGIRVEDKGLSFAVHYRGATAGTVKNARAAMDDLLRPFDGKLRVLNGKRVWEVLPVGIGTKGAAARALLADLGISSLPVYVGDDTTDETAFQALREGITVRVGPARRTQAAYRLRDPHEVREFLEKLEEGIH